MSKKRKSGFDFDDLFDTVFDAPFEALDKGFELLDDGFDTLGRKVDDLLESDMGSLDESMAELDRKMAELDRKLNKKPAKRKHKMTFKHNGERVVVRFNDENDIQIQTSGDLDNELMEEIRLRIREDGGVPTDKPSRPRSKTQADAEDAIRDLRRMAGTAMRRGVPWFSARNWKGGRGKPLEFTADSRVAVSTGGMFGRKYTVEVDGTTVYMLKAEEMMERCWRRGDLNLLVESWTEDERAIMLQILGILSKSGIAERHHEEVAKLLSP